MNKCDVIGCRESATAFYTAEEPKKYLYVGMQYRCWAHRKPRHRGDGFLRHISAEAAELYIIKTNL